MPGIVTYECIPLLSVLSPPKSVWTRQQPYHKLLHYLALKSVLKLKGLQHLMHVLDCLWEIRCIVIMSSMHFHYSNLHIVMTSIFYGDYILMWSKNNSIVMPIYSTFALHIGIGMKKFCKGAVVCNQFWVATLLYDPPSIHYNNQITVRQVCQAMSCQDAYLGNIP